MANPRRPMVIVGMPGQRASDRPLPPFPDTLLDEPEAPLNPRSRTVGLTYTTSIC